MIAVNQSEAKVATSDQLEASPPLTEQTPASQYALSATPPTHNWMLTRTLHSCPLIGCFEQPDLLIGPILVLISAPPGGALFQSSISSVHRGHKTLQTPPRISVPSLTYKSRNPSSSWGLILLKCREWLQQHHWCHPYLQNLSSSVRIFVNTWLSLSFMFLEIEYCVHWRWEESAPAPKFMFTVNSLRWDKRHLIFISVIINNL